MGDGMIRPTPLAGLMLVETQTVGDERGQLTRVFCESDHAGLRPHLHWSQINHSKTVHLGTVRGMHFQYPPSAEAKLIRCLRGRVFDVAVDLRADSPTFLQWHAVELVEDAPTQVFIPEGFAHGFQALTDGVELLYMHTTAWDSAREGALRHDDPRLKIAWPLPVTNVSKKDASAPLLTDKFEGIRL